MRRMATALGVLLLVLAAAGPARAQVPDTLSFLATDLLSGPVDITSNETLLFAIYPTGFTIFDNPDSNSPDSLYEDGFNGEGHAVETIGDYMYLAVGTGGLLVYDVSNPGSPVAVDTIMPDSSFQRMALWQQRLFVIDQGIGLVSFDLRTPASPVLIHLEPVPDEMYDVVVNDSTAYVSTESGGVRIYDVTNFRFTFTGSITVDAPKWLATSGDYLLISRGPGGVRRYDVTNPAAPFPSGSYAPGELIENVAFVDTFVAAYLVDDLSILLFEPNRLNAGPIFALGVPDGVRAMYAVDEKMYVGTAEAGIRIVDIVLPQSTALLGYLEANNQRFQATKLRNDTAFVALAVDGVALVDLSQPGAPHVLTSFQTTNNAFLAQPFRDRAVVSEFGAGIAVYDFSGNETARIQLTNGIINETFIDGTILYAAAGRVGIVSIDLSNPDAPVVLDTIPPLPTGAGASSLDIEGELMAIAEGATIRLVDITNPSAMVLLGQHRTNESVFDVEVKGSAVYGLKQTQGLLVLDAADPAAPDSFASVTMEKPVDQIWWKMEREGDLLYVIRRATFLDAPGALNILQVGNSLEPVLLQSIATRGRGGIFDVDQGLIALGEERDGLEVFTSLEQHALGVVGFAATRSRVSAMHVSGDVMLVGDYDGNLYSYAIFAGDSLARQSSFFLGDRIFNIVARGNLVYVNLNRESVIEFEIQPDGSLDLQNRAVSNLLQPRGLAFDGRYLYVGAADEGLHVYDVTADALRIVEVGSYTTNGTTEGNLALAEADAIYLDEESNLVYVLAIRRQADAHFFTIAVNDPESPQFISSFSTEATTSGGRYFDCIVANGFAYLTKRINGLDVLDVRNPLEPKLHREFTLTGATDLAYAAGFLFVARGLSGYQVLDVRNSEQIQTLFVKPPAGNIQNIDLVGARLLLDNESGISLFGQKIANVDEIAPFLTVGVIPSPWITSYLDIVVVASEQLTAKPRVTFEMGEIDSTLVVLTQDLTNAVYHSTLRLDQVGVGNIRATGEDLAGNKSESLKGFVVRKARGARGGTIDSDTGSVQVKIPPGAPTPESYVYLMSVDARDPKAPRPPDGGDGMVGRMQQLWLGPLERAVEVEAWDLLPDENPDHEDQVPVAHYWTGTDWRSVPTFWDRDTGRARATIPGSGVFAIAWKDGGPAIPAPRVEWHGNRPNPFNPSTRLLFTLPERGHVSLEVYDIAGRRVRTLAAGAYPAGNHAIDWDGTDESGRPIASGVYFARFASGAVERSSRMVLVR